MNNTSQLRTDLSKISQCLTILESIFCDEDVYYDELPQVDRFITIAHYKLEEAQASITNYLYDSTTLNDHTHNKTTRN